MEHTGTEGSILRIIAPDLEFTSPVLEHPLKELHRVTERIDGREGTEDFGALESDIARIPSHEDPGELISDGDREVGKGLVVREPLVEPRPDVLDQPSLQQQGFPLAFALDDVKILDQPKHRRFSRPQIRGRLEVRGDPIGEHRRLSDVQDDACSILHQIDASHSRKSPGLGRQSPHPLIRCRLGVRARTRTRFRLRIRVFGHWRGHLTPLKTNFR